jgi:N-acylglucosamine-6-phosphate 2-epimerase
MDKTELFNRIKGKLIISCQALPGEPLYDPERSLMPYMARAAREAGSPMIRANTVRDVLGIKRETGLPVIGLIKQVYEGFDGYITPTMGEVDALAEAGADIIAIDCTDRRRGDGLSPWEYIQSIKKKYPDQILMADISDYQEGLKAWKSGIDLVSTTMSGYTDYTPKLEGPDFELVSPLSPLTEKMAIKPLISSFSRPVRGDRSGSGWDVILSILNDVSHCSVAAVT